MAAIRYFPTSQCYKEVLFLDRTPVEPILNTLVKQTQVHTGNPFSRTGRCGRDGTCGNQFVLPGTNTPATRRDLPLILTALEEIGFTSAPFITQAIYRAEEETSRIMYIRRKND